MTGEATVKQKTKVAEMKDVIDTIRSIGIDIRDKSYELSSSPSPKDETSKEVATENVGNTILASLHEVRGILREAYETLSVFV